MKERRGIKSKLENTEWDGWGGEGKDRWVIEGDRSNI